MPGPNIPGAVVHLSPRGRLERPELVVAPGPAEIATTGAGTLAALYGYAWALLWDDNTPTLRLFREDGGDWIERTPASPLPELTSPARHIALAFDRSARPMIAWQATDGIRVRQWDPNASQYDVRGPFPGHDPGLVFDGLPAQAIGGGDVVLYYLSDDRASVHARLERDLYGVRYDVATLGRSDLYLDQVVRVPYRVRLELANDQPDAAGQLDRVRLESDLTTIPTRDAADAALAGGTGTYDETTEVHQQADGGDLTVAGGTGTYDETTEVHQQADGGDLTLATATGTYDATTELHQQADGGDLTLATATGTYDHTTAQDSALEGADLSLAAGKGTYQQT